MRTRYIPLILCILFLLCVFQIGFAHNVDAFSYTTIEIKDNKVFFINNPDTPSHLFFAGFEDERRENIIDAVQIYNNDQACVLEDFLTHPEDGLSKEPYYFVAACETPIKNLKIRDEFLIASMTPIYIVNYKNTSLTYTGNPTISIEVELTENSMIPKNLPDTQQGEDPHSSDYSQSKNSPSNFIDIFWTYFLYGLKHILLGLDHIFFILGFILLAVSVSSSLSGLIKGVSGFTISHSITLTLAAKSILTLSPVIVEPLIALSISVVGIFALANIVKSWLTRFSIIFLFGLFHGLGFAGSIEEVGFPQEGFIAALLGFNIGIEIGQLLFIFSVFPLLLLVGKYSPKSHTVLVNTLSLGIIFAGFFWFFQRIL